MNKHSLMIAVSLVTFLTLSLIVYLTFAADDTKKADVKKIPKEIIGKDGAKMVLIPAGEFQMGSNNGKADEKPVHTVYLDAFYMDKYEVTNSQYRKFVKETGYKEPQGLGYYYLTLWNSGGFKPWTSKQPNGHDEWNSTSFNLDNQPVVCVSWEDANAYAKWTGKRLPTEAEWERAARGGLDGKKYSWGDDSKPPKSSGNFLDESVKREFPTWPFIINGYDDGCIYTAPVGSFRPNTYGLYDMEGNVSEWCSDWYKPSYYTKSIEKNPMGPDSGQERVLRGGAWGDNLELVQVSKRFEFNPSRADIYVGFRCVQDFPK